MLKSKLPVTEPLRTPERISEDSLKYEYAFPFWLLLFRQAERNIAVFYQTRAHPV